MNRFDNLDCMIGMKEYPDNYFELAIVDPPYGIGEDGSKKRTTPRRPNSYSHWNKHPKKNWDKDSVDKGVLDEIFRVSQNQIIFGANHFISRMPHDSPCWIVWDKNIGGDFADCELAWTSFRSAVRKFFGHPFIDTNGGKDRIHPTQKPVALYKWLLTKYAKQGDKILDTHVGSASSLIACEDLGFEYVGFELDTDYYQAAQKRLEEYRKQFKLAL